MLLVINVIRQHITLQYEIAQAPFRGKGNFSIPPLKQISFFLDAKGYFIEFFSQSFNLLKTRSKLSNDY